MRERATLRLDSGEELRVELELDDLERDEIVVRLVVDRDMPLSHRLAVIDEILATSTPHPAGTTDRWLEADRESR